MKSGTQTYDCIDNCNIYQPPQLSLESRDVNDFPKLFQLHLNQARLIDLI